jgi:hypothetical protein
MKTTLFISITVFGVAFFASSVFAEESKKPKYATQTPAAITAPAEVQTRRLYGPLEPWFKKTWRPGEIELVK